MRKQPHHRKPRPKWLKTRRGAIVVFAAFMMIVFLATVAFSVDVAYMQLSKVQLRTATDAAARAAGEALSREQCLDCSRQAAKDIAQENLVAGDPLLLDDSDIVFGNSEEQAGGAWAFTPGAEPINAVRVFGRRTREAPSGSVATFFGRVFDVFDFEPTQAATVVRLDRDICLVVDRSSSMKLYLTDTSPTMSTSDSRFCQKPDMTLSRWGALSVAVDLWQPPRSWSTSHWFRTAAPTPRAATRTRLRASTASSVRITPRSRPQWRRFRTRSSMAPRTLKPAYSRASRRSPIRRMPGLTRPKPWSS
jgi:hypothetical protein